MISLYVRFGMIFEGSNNKVRLFKHFKIKNIIEESFFAFWLFPVCQLTLITVNQRYIKQHYNRKMEKVECMGCRTSFHEGEKHKLENLTTEYKNFQLPLKDEKAKRALLKAIVSFLNTRGGIVYIGVEDSQCAVQGQLLQRKDQDSFKLFLKALLEKVHPRVDLNNRQEVAVHFVPVLSKQEFQGKYVVKIIVQQGHPSHLYSFCERVKLEAPTGKVDDFEIFYAYERHNMGGSTELKGLKLLEQVHNRAKAPGKVVSPFHEDCNPEPPQLEVEIRKFHFTNTSKEHMDTLEDAFEDYFQRQSIQYEAEYLKEQRTICLTIEEEDSFKTVLTFLIDNVDYLNREVFRGMEVHFEIKGQKNHYYHIHNNPKPKQKERQERSQREGKEDLEERPLKERQELKVYRNRQEDKSQKEEKPQKETKEPSNNTPKNNNYRFREEERPKEPVRPPVRPPIDNPIKPNKKFVFTLTHIAPRTVDQLEAFLLNSIYRNIDKQVVKYINTVEVVLSSQEDYNRYARALYQREKDLQVYGFKNEIRKGRGTGCLRVCNYDKAKRGQMKGELESLMGDQLREVEFVRDEKGNFSCLVRMRDQSSACEWLDRLLQTRALIRFSNSGSDRRNVFKLKIYLQLQAAF